MHRLPSVWPARRFVLGTAIILFSAVTLAPATPSARQSRQAQRIDEEYTKLIREHSTEKRVMTELVDHLPASDTVPTPLKFLGYVPGTPGKLTYHAEIVKYLEALDKASDRVTMRVIGKSDEGRDMVQVAIADEATIRNLEKYKQITSQLTDPRKTSAELAKQLVATGKPIYYALGSIHTPEFGSPEMLMELAYRLAVGESKFIQEIRNNIIFVFTPATEVDGREKAVDNFRLPQGTAQPGLVYWGQYVQHDNNRDAMGQGLKLTQHMMRAFLDWHPTVWHDLHESVTLLYTSTGTGPYNPIVDAIQVDEWWLLAKTEIMEMTKRGVPGVWTYNFYDGWVPNYLFWIGNTHNSIGRFYETQQFRGQNYQMGAAQSREWYRPNPTPAGVQWGPRSNVNMQQSAILLAMQHVAKNKETYLDNYYIKNRRAIERGQAGAEVPNAYVIPASQHTAAHAADLVNLVRFQGGEVHRANASFPVAPAQGQPAIQVNAGDYIIRMDQPYGPMVESLMGVQWYPADNPRPYDDLGWTFPYLRNVRHHAVRDASILKQPMTLLTADAALTGGVTGTGRTLIINHTTDNKLATFRFMHPKVRMLAAEAEFDAGGRKFGAGSFIIPDADVAALTPSLTQLGLAATAVAAAPSVATHDLDVPRVGYIHTWTSTQDEGWVRLAFDHYKIPYTYFADNTIRAGANLKSKYDVIIFPHTGGSATSIVEGGGVTGTAPRPYKKTPQTPHLGIQDSTDDMRGGLTRDGLRELEKFVAEGGVLITEGATSTIFPEYRITSGVTIETPSTLWVPGSVLKANFSDRTSPLAYGYNQDSIGVYFRSAPVMRVGNAGGGQFGGGRGGGPDLGQPNLTPNAAPPRLTTLWGGPPAGAASQGGGRQGGGRQGGGGPGGGAPGFGASAPGTPRVILQFPGDANDILLSGGMVGGEALAGRAVLVDAPVGKGHVVMFATRPYWRWQTHGLFFLGFNAILHWNDLDAGRGGTRTTNQQ